MPRATKPRVDKAAKTEGSAVARGWRALRTPLLAFVTALIISGVLIVLTDLQVYAAFAHIPMLITTQVEYRWEEVTLEEALQHHPNAVVPGDRVAVDDETLTVVAGEPDDPSKEIALADARARYPQLAPGVTVYFTFWQRPVVGLDAAWRAVSTAYAALFEGSLGNPGKIIAAIGRALVGDPSQLGRAFYPLTESLVLATPYILTGLAVALGFRAGLFNIGAEGQYFIGGLLGVFVGYSLKGWPLLIHLPLTLLAGFIGGGLWGAIPGLLKAKTGAHEVINTIMMNYIAFALADWLLNGPMQRPNDYRPISPDIQPSAMLPQFFASPLRLHLGFVLALVVAGVVYWLLFKTTIGFELRTVGTNSRAARYAGMNLTKNFVLAMFLSGGLAGLAAMNDISGVIHYMPNAFSAGYGFDAIALALLGRSHPLGVVLAALLFGVLRAGAARMQSVAQVPIDIISILQAMIIIFIAAPEIIQALYRLREGRAVSDMLAAKE